MVQSIFDFTDMKEFVEAAKDNGRALWVFHHIPKCAGTSFSGEFHYRVQPSHDVFVGYDETPDDDSFHDAMDAKFEEFRQMYAETPFRFVSGHFQRHHIERLQALADARPIVMLREPLARLASDYRYQQTPAHPLHRSFLKKYRSFEEFIEAPVHQNAMAKYLAGADPTVEQCLELVMHDYVFTGIAEMYPVSVGMVASLLGVGPITPTLTRNVTRGPVPNEIEDLESYRDRVNELNAVDVELYRVVFDELMSRREQMRRVVWPDLVES